MDAALQVDGHFFFALTLIFDLAFFGAAFFAFFFAMVNSSLK